jgi:lysophospholipase L1-like esterase
MSVPTGVPQTRPIAYGGGSITDTAGYRQLTLAAAQAAYTSFVIPGYDAATRGQIPWGLLTRLTRDVVAKNPAVVLLDFAANATDDDVSKQTAEACIRRVRALCPNAAIFMPLFPRFEPYAEDGSTLSNQAVITYLLSLAATYDALALDIKSIMVTAIGLGAEVSDWYTSADGVHPDAVGHQFITDEIMAVWSEALFAFDGSQYGSIPDRVYDSVEWENTEINIDAIDGVAVGTWATSTTRLTSATVGSTLEFTGTFRSYGLEWLGGGISHSVDGGAYSAAVAASPYTDMPVPLDLTLERAAHTVTIKVESGTVEVVRFIAV